MACLRKKPFDVLKEIIREPLLLLFLRFDVVVEKLDSQLRRQLIVQCLPNKIAVLGCNGLFSVILCFSQIEAHQRVPILFKTSRKVFPSRNRLLI